MQQIDEGGNNTSINEKDNSMLRQACLGKHKPQQEKDHMIEVHRKVIEGMRHRIIGDAILLR